MTTIVSVASGKGGVGKSMIAANLALSTARRGLRVALVDLDVGGADAHVLFGVHRPVRTLEDMRGLRLRAPNEIVPVPKERIVEMPANNLSLIFRRT